MALQEKLGDIKPLPHPAVQPLWTKSDSQVTVEAFSIETDPGILLPIYLLKPANPPAKPAPLVLAIAQGGKAQFLSERAEDVMTLLRNGIAVCLPDLRDSGEVAHTVSRGPGAPRLGRAR